MRTSLPSSRRRRLFTTLYRQDKRVRLVRHAGEGHTISARANVLDMWRHSRSGFQPDAIRRIVVVGEELTTGLHPAGRKRRSAGAQLRIRGLRSKDEGNHCGNREPCVHENLTSRDELQGREGRRFYMRAGPNESTL